MQVLRFVCLSVYHYNSLKNYVQEMFIGIVAQLPGQ